MLLENNRFQDIWIKWKRGVGVTDADLRFLHQHFEDTFNKVNIILNRGETSTEFNPTTHFLKQELTQINDCLDRRNL